MRFDASPHPKTAICHLQGLAKTLVTVGTLPLGQIWFRFVIEVARTRVLTDQATRKHLPSTLRSVTECLRPTLTDNLLVLSGIQPTKLCRQEATLSLANRSSLDPDHILYVQLTESQAASKKRLKSRHPFVPATRKLLHNLSALGIRDTQRTNLTWNTEYSESTSALYVYIPKVSTKPIEMGLTRTALVKLTV